MLPRHTHSKIITLWSPQPCHDLNMVLSILLGFLHEFWLMEGHKRSQELLHTGHLLTNTVTVNNANKYKTQLNKLQSRDDGVNKYTNKCSRDDHRQDAYRYVFHRNLCCLKMCCRVHLIPNYPCLCTLWPYHPYFCYFFIFSCHLYMYLSCIFSCGFIALICIPTTGWLYLGFSALNSCFTAFFSNTVFAGTKEYTAETPPKLITKLGWFSV